MIGRHIGPDLRASIEGMLADGKRVFEIQRATGCAKETIRSIRDGTSAAKLRPTPQPERFTAYVSCRDTSKPRIRVKARNCITELEPVIQSVVRVVVIADTHDSPDLPQDRFQHIGEFIKEHSPDVVVHVGDWADFSFNSRFEDRSSIDGRELPSFQDDMDSLFSAVEKLQTPIAHMSKPPRLVTTLGNHEQRIWDWENAHPQTEGMMWSQLERALQDWEVHPYREWAFVGSVGFTHVPQSKMNKPLGGENVGRTIANRSTFSVVFGHTHESCFLPAAKLGPDNHVTVFNPGCALPQGYVKSYARGTSPSWSIGTLDICDGRIIGHSIVPMGELERRYG